MRKGGKNIFDKLYNDPGEVDEECMANIDEMRNYKDIPDLWKAEVEAAIRSREAEKSSGPTALQQRSFR